MDENEQTADVDLDNFLSDEDNQPLTEEAFNELGGRSALDEGPERLSFLAASVTKEESTKFGEVLVLRLDFEVAQQALTNDAGRRTSVWLRFPNTKARATMKNARTMHNMSNGTLKDILMALLNGTDASNPGDYPIVDGPNGPGLMSPFSLINRADLVENLLKGRECLVELSKQAPTWTDDKGNEHRRRRINNEYSSWCPVP